MHSTPRKIILVIDDVTSNIDILSSILRNDYQVKAATSGHKALKIAGSSAPPDLILLDVVMPEMDGFEVCRRLKANPLTHAIPVIFVTDKIETEYEADGFSCGAVDYITKPVCAPIVEARVRTHLALYDSNRFLEEKVRERTAELTSTRLEILRRLGMAAEYKDNETGMHIIRMSRYAQLVALQYGLSVDESELILHAAPMHDVGKIGIPDRVLLKPGGLDHAEWNIMRRHCYMGYKIIGDHNNELLQGAATIAYTHHEKWDGSGYPRGLGGESIPLIGRITAVSDVFDALTSKRPYKKAWPLDEALDHLQRSSGSHFDPKVVAAFTRSLPEILAVKEQFADEIAVTQFLPEKVAPQHVGQSDVGTFAAR
jgi:putative two-component system response regulator